MKLRVVHLLKKLEKVHRDIEELENLEGNIRRDREYSSTLRNSLVDEATRLKELKNQIHNQVIKNPSEKVLKLLNQETPPLPAETSPSTAVLEGGREPEIILPEKSAKSSSKPAEVVKSRPASSTSKPRGKTTPKKEATSPEPPKEKPPTEDSPDTKTFQFRYK